MKMKTNNLTLPAFMALTFAVSLGSCSLDEKKATEKQVLVVDNSENDVKRGEYLVAIMGCHDCHSPKQMGAKGPEIIPELMLSGYPAERPIVKFNNPLQKEGFSMFYPDLTGADGPWGVSFAANITPDATGIGTWTKEQFKNALTKGKYKGLDTERNLLPPMPWFNYAFLKDEDSDAIFAYLKSIKPVKNVVPDPISPDKM
jgi:hypothetical protein